MPAANFFQRVAIHSFHSPRHAALSRAQRPLPFRSVFCPAGFGKLGLSAVGLGP